MQASGTTAGLRGIDSVDGTVAWASGTGGTVLKTIDGGAHWTRCAVPDADKDGATLDFRGVQAWDAQTAIVMSSGKGKLSRLYKTKDGCRSWRRIFTNPDKEGFWDALYFEQRRWDPAKALPGRQNGWILGDPVRGSFSLFRTDNSGVDWYKQKNKGLRVKPGSQGAFAASNTSLIAFLDLVRFGSGGTGGAALFSVAESERCLDCNYESFDHEGRGYEWSRERVPVGNETDSSGIFSIAAERLTRKGLPPMVKLVAVGGDYSNPSGIQSTAAFKLSYDQPWTASETPPHGYRSAVQWSEALKLWITVGTNGSDVSRDDGKTWQPLDDGNWNALSLPFVVGPNGRIAKLDAKGLER